MPIPSAEEFTSNFAEYLDKNMHDSFPVDAGWYTMLAKLIYERDEAIRKDEHNKTDIEWMHALEED